MGYVSRSNKSGSDILPILKTSNQWVCWAYNYKGDFIPLDTDDYDSTRERFEASRYRDQSIRLPYETAKQLADEHDSIDGIGFVVVDTAFSYVDFDNCLNPDTGEVHDDVLDLIHEIDSYTEISISGTGIHIYCRGSAPSYGWAPKEYPHEISVFDGSWTVVTENHLEGFPASVQSKPAKLREICKDYDIDIHGGWG